MVETNAGGELEFDFGEEKEVNPSEEFAHGAKFLLNHLNRKPRYGLVIGGQNERVPEKRTVFNSGENRVVFDFGPDSRIGQFRMHGFCSDSPTMVVAAYAAVKRRWTKEEFPQFFRFWKLGILENKVVNYLDSSISELNGFVHPEASRLEYAPGLSFKRHPQETSGSVFLDESVVKVQNNGAPTIPLSYRLRFNANRRGLVLGLGTLNEMYDIIRFLDRIPKGRDLVKSPFEMKLGGSNRKLMIGSNGLVSILASDGEIGSFLSNQWNDFVNALKTKYDGYSHYLETLLVSESNK